MSGECDSCGEHCLDCICSDIKVWAQMFFDDGSVTQGIRISAESIYNQKEVALKLLSSVNRKEGMLLIWGAGLLSSRYYDFEPISSSQTEA